MLLIKSVYIRIRNICLSLIFLLCELKICFLVYVSVNFINLSHNIVFYCRCLSRNLLSMHNYLVTFKFLCFANGCIVLFSSALRSDSGSNIYGFITRLPFRVSRHTTSYKGGCGHSAVKLANHSGCLLPFLQGVTPLEIE